MSSDIHSTAADDTPPAENNPGQAGAQAGHTGVPAKPKGPRSTFAGRFWATLGFTVLVVVLLIIFIAENSQRVTIHYLGASGSISAALALLIAAVAGAILMLLVGTIRILQLRGEVRRTQRRRRR